jgi:hypothetical protein
MKGIKELFACCVRSGSSATSAYLAVGDEDAVDPLDESRDRLPEAEAEAPVALGHIEGVNQFDALGERAGPRALDLLLDRGELLREFLSFTGS